MDTIFDQFTNQYRVNKTLRFRLKPIGKTEQHIKEKGLLKKDEELADKYKLAKKIIDEYHKDFIHSRLQKFSFKHPSKNKKGDLLQEFACLYYDLKNNNDRDNEKLKEELGKKQNNLRKKIADALKNDAVFKATFIKEDLPQWLKKNPISIDGVDDPEAIIKEFEKQTTYFTGFNENRKNIYTSKPHSTAVGYRLIHENLPKFLDNIKRYEKAKELGVDFSSVEKEFNAQLDKDFFTVASFNKYLTQEGIEKYNLIRGGLSKENEKKRQGVNEIINLHAQKLENPAAKEIRSCQLEELYKQILSDRVGISFRQEDIANDAAVCKKIISTFKIDKRGNLIGQHEHIDKKTGESTTSNFNITKKLEEALDSIKESDPSKLYIKNDRAISNISQDLWGEWNTIQHCLEHYVEKNIYLTPESGRESESLNKKRKKWLKQSYFSFDCIHKALKTYFEQYTEDELRNENKDAKNMTGMKWQRDIAISKPLFDYFKNLKIRKKNEKGTFEPINLLNEIQKTYKKLLPVLEKYKNTPEEKLKNSKEEVQIVKSHLDALMDLYHFLKPLSIQNNKKEEEKTVELFEKDSSFYSDFDLLFDVMEQIVPLYNQTRNYLTKKPYSVEKFKLNFENPTLAAGWDKNEETSKACVILIKDEQYFLGVMDKGNKKLFEKDLPASKNSFQKMEYKLLPDPKKMLPKVFFSRKHIEFFNPSKEISDIRNTASHTKDSKPREGFQNAGFCISDMRKIIDFYKKSIAKHPDWKLFNFSFSQTKDYSSFADFCKEVEHQGYQITFQKVSEDYINHCVDEGKLYLFQIYSKDFSPKTRGAPNLQTLYWKALFDEKNLQDIIYKLDGKAELFYRKASIKYSNEISKKGHHANDPKKKQRYPIIKNRRYTQDTFLFHIPITCNFKAAEVQKNIAHKFNNEVNKFLKGHPDINIIGIDRGERHLAYYTIINQKGEIIKNKGGKFLQDSLNTPGNQDYQKLLDTREKERDQARKSWGTIQKIKDLKEGYLSQVVPEITNLMLEYNAIVIFEDLNFGFKKGRFKVEKQVYQKLEKRLIDKLNYLVFKNKGSNKAGGVLKALQLTAPFESFKKLGKQTGVIFYTPAYYTSKVCPATGFVNLLYPRYETMEKAKQFFQKFDKIIFNKDDNYFEFHFNYEKFTNKASGGKQNWIVCSHGIRLKNFKDHDNNNQWKTCEVNLTKAIKELLKDKSIAFEDGKCLIEKITQQDKSDFFKSLIDLLKLTLQMRNSKIGTKEDWMISPVKDNEGRFFDSTKTDLSMPQNADANGAYHIALKGLLMLKQLNKTTDAEKFKPDLTNRAWFKFIQERH